jgi:hypothetical protein
MRAKSAGQRACHATSIVLGVVQGRPIYIQLLGKIDIATLKQITTEERMIKFHIQEYERCGKVIMPICSKLQGRQIDQTFGIMDVKGEQRGARGCVRCLLGQVASDGLYGLQRTPDWGMLGGGEQMCWVLMTGTVQDLQELVLATPACLRDGRCSDWCLLQMP